MFVLVRGFYGRGSADIRIGDITVPASARLVTQENSALLQPLDYYNLLSLGNATQGLVLMTTLSVLSGTPNFMEVRMRERERGSRATLVVALLRSLNAVGQE